LACPALASAAAARDETAEAPADPPDQATEEGDPTGARCTAANRNCCRVHRTRLLRRRCDHSRVDPLERFSDFRRIVLGDPALQEQLRSIPDWPGFVEAAIGAASARGIALSEEDVLAARRDARRSWLERWV